MKSVFVASDIHGSALWCRRMLERFAASEADRLLLLGDILYHGPRNELPEGYAPKEVIAMLNPLADKILCVRGNCEAEVDQMVLDFPVMADYIGIFDGKLSVYATHGHLWGEDKPLPACRGSVLLCGHTHVSKYADHSSYIYMNPGSVSIPKENTPHGYMLYGDGLFTWYDLESGAAYMTKRLC